jgi:protein-S-isoprenylcysteine O-methyltransferase Ste14
VHRLVVAAVFTLVALAAGMQTIDSIAMLVADPTLHSWAVAGYSLLKTGVAAAFTVFVLVRAPSRRPSRDPIAFLACAGAIGAVIALQRPSDSASTALVLAGELVTLVSGVWLLVSALALGRCFGILPEVRGLVTRGPYRLVRHPIYLGELGACAGLVLASPTTWNLGVGAAFAAAQATRMRLEERALLGEFPAYAEYAATTPRLLPRLGGISIARRLQRAMLVVVSLLAAGLLLSSGAGARGPARLKAPVPISPVGGAQVALVPSFAWNPVPGADRYEFQIAADAGFNAPVLGAGHDRFFTRNTRATLKKTVPNGLYWWRVRASKPNGATSPWSRGRSLRKSWTARAALQSPSNGSVVAYPLTPLRLAWSPVLGATSYEVSIASDPLLGSRVTSLETQATTFTRAGALPSGTYYWGITPIDAQGHKGVPSEVWSFVWFWPSAMSPRFADLAAEPEVVDPQFSWDAVPGAARYEVEVNSSQDFAPGSRVCCTTVIVGTSHSPPRVFKDNIYYWRVRAFDPDGNAGVWNDGPVFSKRFDKVPPVAGTSIKNVRMRDNLADPGADVSPDPGYQTNVPIVRWDAVPGASSYEVEVTAYDVGLGYCNWSSTARWLVKTAATAWSPLGTGLTARPPFGNPTAISRDFTKLILDQRYCARVRARSNRDLANSEVYGEYTELDNGDSTGWAFQWTGYPSGGPCSPSCTPGFLGSGDFVLPSRGTTVSQTPLLTWRPIAGRESYFIIVAKDQSFTNIVDYAFTQVPAYAPRTAVTPTTYPDETTTYYWVVLPAAFANGDGAVGNPLLGAPSTFEKRSGPPTRIQPADGSVLSAQPTFRWTLALGARRYRLQVSQDPTFGDPIEDVLTDATAYTTTTTYPADTVLYWRVRADDENLVGLTWSSTGTFQKRLPAPIPSASNPTRGDFIPTWTWDSIIGAVSYDISADLPDGTHRNIAGLRTAALTPILMYGTGLFHWRVRANFPKAPFGSVPGPYSATMPFTRTIGEPTGAHADASDRRMLLSWESKPGVKKYRVQISARADFAVNIENITTDNTSYAPLLLHPAYVARKALWWRVAGVDEGNNVGDYTPAQQIGAARRMRLAVRGRAARNRSTAVYATVRDLSGAPLKGATVRVSGAGMRPRAGRTGASGRVRLRIRPTRHGKVTYRATKAGYSPAVLTVRVR